MGGCSAINGGVYIRGQREDYDAWEHAGNKGWAYRMCCPALWPSRITRARQALAWQGRRAGCAEAALLQSDHPCHHRVRAAGGPSAQRRFRGERQAGFGPYDLNQRRGTRLSSARAFLNPVLKRPNLTVLSDTLARRILFDRGRATGLEIEQAGERRVLQARREVVLCGGAINSPQLLMLSGIGPAAHLREKGIEVLCDLPGVGAHLQDHPTVHVAMENPSAESYALSPRTYGRILLSPLRYLLRRDGMLASNVAECGGFLCTDGSGRPDIQITFLVGLKANARVIPSEHGYMALIQLLRPKSEGSVRLASSDPGTSR
jgi:choline dehydrogenase-like flavoprotein